VTFIAQKGVEKLLMRRKKRNSNVEKGPIKKLQIRKHIFCVLKGVNLKGVNIQDPHYGRNACTGNERCHQLDVTRIAQLHLRKTSFDSAIRLLKSQLINVNPGHEILGEWVCVEIRECGKPPTLTSSYLQHLCHKQI
jgi:hypothetical protein